MQSNVRKQDSGGSPSSRVNPAGDVKHPRKSHTRKIPYKVGYTWNKGGRLKELRIRHLARKFLWIWIQNTFGRVLPQKAKSHYNRRILRRAFEGWRDEWWASMREWSLTTRAECHYKYHLCALTFQQWQVYVPLHKEKRKIGLSAQSHVEKRVMSQALDRWKGFTRMKQKKKIMLQSALELNKLKTLHSTWHFWQMRLQRQLVLHSLAEEALKENALYLQKRTWLWWKNQHLTARSQRENESKAAVHFDLKVKRKILYHWRSCAAHLKTKKKFQALAQCFLHVRLLRLFWCKWTAALYLRQWDENSPGCLALQHRALVGSLSDEPLCKVEDQRNRIAKQHYEHPKLTVKHWNMWKTHLEEAKDRKLQPLVEESLEKQRKSVLCNFFYSWRDKLSKLRHRRELTQHAHRTLALCFNSWRYFTLQRRLLNQRRQEAEGYNQQRRYAWVFYTWWSRAEEFKNQRLLERIAIQHQEQRNLKTGWTCWRQRIAQRRETQMASYHIIIRKNQERLPSVEDDRHSMLAALERLREEQQFEKSQLPQVQRCYEDSVLKNTFVACQNQNIQDHQQLHSRLEKLHKQQKQKLSLCKTIRFLEEQAQDHFQGHLQRKMFYAWRKATTCAVSNQHQQGEAVSDAQRSMNEVRLLQSPQCWRKKAKGPNLDETSMEKARRHHESKLLLKALAGWKKYHNQCYQSKIRKRQGKLLFKLKMYQKYFEQWKKKLQRRQKEFEQTERALWHWSVTLQAKVLRSWRLCLSEQRGRWEQVARESQVHRDQLPREGVSNILTYDAHLSKLTTTLTQHSDEQRLQRLHRVVRTCAMRWKQRALVKPQNKRGDRETQPKKTVTFCLTSTEFRTLSPCYSEEDKVEEHNNLRLNCDRRDQIGGCEAMLQTPLNIYTQRQPVSQREYALLPPSAFMTSSSENMPINACSSGFGDGFHQQSTSADTSSGETLVIELLSIQLDMKTYQQDKKQLQAWQKLRDVLKGWLQTSGKDDQMESKAVFEDLQELEDRIDRLAAELTERKPTMRLQAARVQHLHSLLSELPLNKRAL